MTLVAKAALGQAVAKTSSASKKAKVLRWARLHRIANVAPPLPAPLESRAPHPHSVFVVLKRGAHRTLVCRVTFHP